MTRFPMPVVVSALVAVTTLSLSLLLSLTASLSLSALPAAHALRFDVGLPGLGNISYRDGLLRIRPPSSPSSSSGQEATATDPSSWTVPETAFWGPAAEGGRNAAGISASIEHKLTPTKGYGAFYTGTNDLPMGSFLGLYEGRLVRSREALDRLHASRRAGESNDPSGGGGGGVADYVLSLDGGVNFLDGYEYRYRPSEGDEGSAVFTPAHLNHADKDSASCNVLRKLVYVPDDWEDRNNANANDAGFDAEAWFREAYPKNLPRVAFFAGRDIAPVVCRIGGWNDGVASQWCKFSPVWLQRSRWTPAHYL